jgi:hypothetical protein
VILGAGPCLSTDERRATKPPEHHLTRRQSLGIAGGELLEHGEPKWHFVMECRFHAKPRFSSKAMLLNYSDSPAASLVRAHSMMFWEPSMIVPLSSTSIGTL